MQDHLVTTRDDLIDSLPPANSVQSIVLTTRHFLHTAREEQLSNETPYVDGRIVAYCTVLNRVHNATPTEKCEWKAWRDEDGRTFETSCGTDFSFEAGGIKDNQYNYCPRCGQRIKEVPNE